MNIINYKQFNLNLNSKQRAQVVTFDRASVARAQIRGEMVEVPVTGKLTSGSGGGMVGIKYPQKKGGQGKF